MSYFISLTPKPDKSFFPLSLRREGEEHRRCDGGESEFQKLNYTTLFHFQYLVYTDYRSGSNS